MPAMVARPAGAPGSGDHAWLSPGDAVDKGQLAVPGPADAYLTGGSFDLEAMIRPLDRGAR